MRRETARSAEPDRPSAGAARSATPIGTQISEARAIRISTRTAVIRPSRNTHPISPRSTRLADERDDPHRGRGGEPQQGDVEQPRRARAAAAARPAAARASRESGERVVDQPVDFEHPRLDQIEQRGRAAARSETTGECCLHRPRHRPGTCATRRATGETAAGRRAGSRRT